MNVGLSSMCAPGASASGLLDLVRAAGGRGLDLRAGKGHAWETDDFASVLEREPIAFVGTSIELGDPSGFDPSSLSTAVLAWVRARELPLRCFVPTAPVGARVADDIERLHELAPGSTVLIEAHRREPSLAVVDELLELTSARAVVDVLGAQRAGATWAEIADFAHRRGAAVQIKGFTPDHRHAPLRDVPEVLSASRAVLEAVPDLPVTVETKAGSAVDDIRLLLMTTRSGGEA